MEPELAIISDAQKIPDSWGHAHEIPRDVKAATDVPPCPVPCEYYKRVTRRNQTVTGVWIILHCRAGMKSLRSMAGRKKQSTSSDVYGVSGVVLWPRQFLQILNRDEPPRVATHVCHATTRPIDIGRQAVTLCLGMPCLVSRVYKQGRHDAAPVTRCRHACFPLRAGAETMLWRMALRPCEGRFSKILPWQIFQIDHAPEQI
jgi:hypothetical protein